MRRRPRRPDKIPAASLRPPGFEMPSKPASALCCNFPSPWKHVMKICIYGAGAIGGYLGVQLARAGADVSLVARGPHLAAMRKSGLKLLIGDEERVVHPRCPDNPAELGPQDFVIVCLKAHSITGVIEQMQPLLGPRTRIVTAVNGIPYWYFYRHGGRYEGSTLESIDPGGRQWRELTPQRAIGCIVYPATET